MPQQLTFTLPVSVSQGAEDFFVSDANAQAYSLVRRDAAWPEGKLCLIGPRGSGKSHLTRVWQADRQADVVEAATLTGAEDLPAAGAGVALEGMEHLPPHAQEYVFHLHNHLKATQGRLLLTATCPPAHWGLTLPDLLSRMQAATLVRIADPDDDLLNAVMLKQFADRQLMPAPHVLNYILSRTERSFSAIADVVGQIDVMALSRKSAITRALARDVLDATAPLDPDTPTKRDP